MEKVETKAVIKHLCKKGMSPMEIHEDFMDTHEKESPSYIGRRSYQTFLKVQSKITQGFKHFTA
jgi:hypothetical protein